MHFAASPRCCVHALFFCGRSGVWRPCSVCCGEGRGLQSVCPADTTIMPPLSVSMWTGCWVGPRRKCLYLLQLCYFSGPQGFIWELFWKLWQRFCSAAFGCKWSLCHFFTQCVRNARVELYIPSLQFIFSFECTFVRSTYSYGVSGDISLLALLQGVR